MIWLLPIVASAPWVTAIVWFWPPREERSDDEVRPSMGDLAARRLRLR